MSEQGQTELELLQASTCFGKDVCKSLPCACAAELTSLRASQAALVEAGNKTVAAFIAGRYPATKKTLELADCILALKNTIEKSQERTSAGGKSP